jgi:hypothetical protein
VRGITTLLPITPSAESDLLPVIDHDGSRIAYVYDGRIANVSGRHPVVGRFDWVTGQRTRMMGASQAPGAVSPFGVITINATGGRVGFTSWGSLDPMRPSSSHSTFVATG